MLQRIIAGVALALAAIALPASSALAQGGRPLMAVLTGGELGDRDGSGVAWLELNQGQGTICFDVRTQGTSPVSNLRVVHMATNRSLVLLQNGVGMAARCAPADAEFIKTVRQNAGEYGVVVGTSQFPHGAIAGTLMQPSDEQVQEYRGIAVVQPPALPVEPPASPVELPALPKEVEKFLDGLRKRGVNIDALDIERIAEVDWNNVDLKVLRLKGIDLEGVNWGAVDLAAIDWAAIDWENLDLRNLDLRNVDWGNLDLRNLYRNGDGDWDDDWDGDRRDDRRDDRRGDWRGDWRDGGRGDNDWNNGWGNEWDGGRNNGGWNGDD